MNVKTTQIPKIDSKIAFDIFNFVDYFHEL